MSSNKRLKTKNFIEIFLITIIILGFGGGAVYFDRYIQTGKTKEGRKKVENESNNTSGIKEKEAKAVSVSSDNSKEKSIVFTSNNPLNEVYSLLGKYNWKIAEILNIEETKIPNSFIDQEGEAPVGLYWAYCNEISKSMGYDMSIYKGEKVKKYFVSIKNKSNEEDFAFIFVNRDKVVGMWCIGRDMRASNLYGKTFKDITALSWNEWLVNSGFENYKSSYNQEEKKLTPQQVINRYFSNITNKNYKGAFLCFSKYQQSDSIAKIESIAMEDVGKSYFMHMPFMDAKQINIFEVNEEKVSSRSEFDLSSNSVNRSYFETKVFCAKITFNLEFDGKTTKTYANVRIYLIRESKDAPWQIENIQEFLN